MITGPLTVLALAAAVATPYLPAAPADRAPMGSTLVVDSRSSGAQTLYTTSPDWTKLDCTATTESGTEAQLRADMTAQGMPGPPAWEPSGGLIDAGRLTIRCDDPRGGEFGVGPTRSLGFVIMIILLYGLALLLAVPTLILLIIDLAGRRRSDLSRQATEEN